MDSLVVSMTLLITQEKSIRLVINSHNFKRKIKVYNTVNN